MKQLYESQISLCRITVEIWTTYLQVISENTQGKLEVRYISKTLLSLLSFWIDLFWDLEDR